MTIIENPMTIMRFSARKGSVFRTQILISQTVLVCVQILVNI